MSYKILHVDDDPLILKIYGAAFSSHGHAIDTASSAEEAIQHLKSNPPQLVILDLFLPRTPGVEILRYIRCQPSLQKLPVIIFSNSYTSRYIDLAQRLGVSRFLTKDAVDPDQLVLTADGILASANPNSNSPFPGVPNLQAEWRSWLRAFLCAPSEAERRLQLAALPPKLEELLCHSDFHPGSTLARFAEALLKFSRRLTETPAPPFSSPVRTLVQAVETLAYFFKSEASTSLSAGLPNLIVLVQDNSELCQPEAFQKINQISLSFSDPFSAISVLEKNSAGLIFSDLRLTQLSGSAFVTRLRELPRHRSTPIVLFVPAEEFASLGASNYQGATDIMAKPFTLDELLVKSLVHLAVA